MKKVLFIDRDGTIIVEPQDDFQVDTLEELEYIPGVFRYLSQIAEELDYELVMVTNQDGLGTAGYPEEAFEMVHGKMLTALKNEGIEFSEILIDKSFPEENLPTRKPGTGLLTEYMKGDYDLKNSFVIGDRMTDMQLAMNLGCKGIHILRDTKPVEGHDVIALQTPSWKEVYEFLRFGQRKVTVERDTKETQIKIELNLDGEGKSNISTGIGFFDHMLEQLSRHGLFDLNISVKGDLYVDEHHSIEDTALVLGSAFKQALGNKKGIERYGFFVPMDDSLANVVVDFGGRNWLEWKAEFNREKVGEMPTEMFFHFFKSFTDTAQCNLFVQAEGANEHHKIEAIFKAFAKALKMAVKRDNSNILPSTKGAL
ncbi:MAG: bifunctional histidinol-phosphatase/imidazoleglycerol-phosphate dehydratase HisB [Bacteroidales bacterium]|nr:bifunctional histidinol-phosphatase/imidazoleglycerol-phosphate dehydratase HisB [Bacteroidales bacterium]